MRAVRSPDVGAEKAPPVRPSSGWLSALLVEGVFTAGVSGLADLDMGKRSIWISRTGEAGDLQGSGHCRSAPGLYSLPASAGTGRDGRKKEEPLGKCPRPRPKLQK